MRTTIRCAASGPGRYKLVCSYEDPPLLLPIDIEQSRSRQALGRDHLRARSREELYDLVADPPERHRLAAEPTLADVRADLLDRVVEWQNATADPVLHGHVPPPPAGPAR